MNLTESERFQLIILCLLTEDQRNALDSSQYGHLRESVESIKSDTKQRLQEHLASLKIKWDGASKLFPFIAENLAIESTAKYNEERLQKAMSYLAVASKAPNLRDNPIVSAEVKKAAETIAELLG